MTTYNTGNPIGSTAVKDLFDNAENLDRAANDRAALNWTDRLGHLRRTWHGIEQKADFDIGQAVSEATAQAEQARDDAIAAASASGDFEFSLTYADAEDLLPLPDGTIVEVAQDETHDGSRTRYVVESGALVFAVDLDQLRVDLADPAKGAFTIARGVVSVPDIPSLLALPAEYKRTDLRYEVDGYNPGSNVGGGMFRYDPSKVGENDYGLVINGFVRRVDGPYNFTMFGVVPNSAMPSTPLMQRAINVMHSIGGKWLIPEGEYLQNGDLDFLAGSGLAAQEVKWSLEFGGLVKFKAVAPIPNGMFFVNGRARRGHMSGRLQLFGEGLAEYGFRMCGNNYWNTTGLTVEAFGCLQRNIYLGPVIGLVTGGLWNKYGDFISEGQSLETPYTEIGIEVGTVFSNTFLGLTSLRCYVSDAILLDGGRNVVLGFSIEGSGQPLKTFNAGLRVLGEWTLVRFEAETSHDPTPYPGFESALVVEPTGRLTIGSRTTVGFSTGNNPLVKPGGMLFISGLYNHGQPISGGRAEVYSDKGLVIKNPLIRAPYELVTTTISSIGISNTYGPYQTVLALSHASAVQGTRIIQSMRVTNNTNQDVQFQIRNRIAGSEGPNNLSFTVPSGDTKELTASEISYIVNNATYTAGLVARYRLPSAGSYTGTMDWEIGSINI